MMYWRVALTILVVAGCARAGAQGVLGDVFSGKLINPEPGVWAWYELSDKATGAKFYLRQAIVGAEAVKRKDGFWVETELTPQEGFSSIFKMLLTGPASDPKNIHQLIIKEGQRMPESVPVPQEGYTPGNEGARTLVGAEKVKIGNGEEVDAEHFTIGSGAEQADVWINDAVRPMGIVKMISSDGELLLQRYGVGGKEANSVINEYVEEVNKKGGPDQVKTEVRINGEKKDTPKKDSAAPKEAAPAAEPAPSAKSLKKGKPKEK